MTIIKAPNEYSMDEAELVFLAGSIEMGAAENWQDRIGRELSEMGYIVLNPRRDDWDSSWVQSIDNPQFYEQVNWELDALRDADWIILYFDPNTKSPISLLELGIFGGPNMIVVCPDGFWRKGNVDIVCKRFNIPMRDTLEEAIDFLRY